MGPDKPLKLPPLPQGFQLMDTPPPPQQQGAVKTPPLPEGFVPLNNLPEGTALMSLPGMPGQYALVDAPLDETEATVAEAAAPVEPASMEFTVPTDVPNLPEGYVHNPPPAPRDTSGPLANFQIGSQGAGAGLAGLAGIPVDIVSLIMNAGLAGTEMATNVGMRIAGGEPIGLPRVREPFGGSDWIRNKAGETFEAAGGKLFQPEDMNTAQRLAYNVNRYGTEALAAGGALSKVSQARFGNQVTPITPRYGDKYLRQYSGGNAGPVLKTDATGGVGMGAGVTVAEENFPDNPLAAAIMGLTGGFTGALTGAAATAPKNLAQTIYSHGADPNIPYAPGSTDPISRRAANASARFVQDAATDPHEAALRIAERQRAAALNSEPMPSVGLASDDIGLVGTELGARRGADTANPHLNRKFAERDEALQARAGENVGSTMDPDADIAAGLSYAKQRPSELADIRDAEALPILRQAEASGAVVDATPVANLIEDTLSKTKRPAVRNALTEARSMLNKVGSDELDTSVSGLYETRKAINDIIQGRTDSPTGQYAKSELIEVRKALDEVINESVPEFGEYLAKYREGSRALDVFRDSKAVARMVETETDMRNVAKRLLGSTDYGTEEAMKAVTSVVKNDPKALRAWKASVAEELNRRVRGYQDGEVRLSSLNTTFQRHEKALAEVFTSGEMNTLKRAHEMLKPLANLEKGVRAGTQPGDNTRMLQVMEGAILATTGNAITTGMIMKRFRVMANLMGLGEMTLSHEVREVVGRMWFDPDLARHLLERPVKEGTGPLWNTQLRRLLAGQTYSRESTDVDKPREKPKEEPKDETVDTIMRSD